MFTAIVHPDMYCQLTRRCTTTSIGPTTRLEISNDQLTLRMSFANTIDMIGYDDTYRMYMLYMYACTMCMKLPLLTPSPFCLEKEHYSRHIHIIICFDSCFVLDWIYFNTVYRTSIFVLSPLAFLRVLHLCSHGLGPAARPLRSMRLAAPSGRSGPRSWRHIPLRPDASWMSVEGTGFSKEWGMWKTRLKGGFGGDLAGGGGGGESRGIARCRNLNGRSLKLKVVGWTFSSTWKIHVLHPFFCWVVLQW